MLDRATIERLSQAPEKNAPMLNVALAEEGHAKVLLALARCAVVGPEALAVIGDRIAADGSSVGRDPEARPDEPFEPIDAELDRLLIARQNAPDALRDAVLARHPDDPFFVLAAACHPAATPLAIERAADWPAASPAHDRLWIALLDSARIPPLVAEEWAQDASPLRRETIARNTHDPALLAALARDPDRRVRRAVASNRAAADLRDELAANDIAAEVRARAAGSLSAHEGVPDGGNIVETARFAAALRARGSLGVLAPDTRQALSSGGAALDEEGALIAAEVLSRAEVIGLLDRVVDTGPASPPSRGFSTGLALRCALPGDEEDDAGENDGDLVCIVYDAMKPLARLPASAPSLTGKAKLAAWMAESLMASPFTSTAEVLSRASRGSLAGDRMVLARAASRNADLVPALCDLSASREGVPPSLLTLAWSDPRVTDAAVLDLAGRIARPRRRAEGELPEDEVDLDPLARPLPVLERAVLTTALRASVSPRGALAVIAMDSRRVRYVVSAMPTWKGRLTGAKLARVVRQNAGALSAAQAESRARSSKVEGWTQRLLNEIEMSIALALGHLTGAEAAARLASGRQSIDDGLSLSAGVLARAALEGARAVAPVLDWAAKNRGAIPAALALWLLVEQIDRERAASLIASAVDNVATSKAGVPSPVCDALSALELRRPGRLEGIFPQSPRGRATMASAIARSYRALGGMRDERQDG
ncbi:MAG: hypothetical protein R3B70_34235 [Polyangiaceae bacterium]